MADLNPEIFYCIHNSPLGPLVLGGAEGRLEFLYFPKNGIGKTPEPWWIENQAPYETVLSELDGYFSGQLHHFTSPYQLNGSDFQRSVWKALAAIPFGEVRSYGDIAREIGQPGGSRAVGLANNANPLPIIVPCHRVIGADGSLVGFGGGLDTKIWLLNHEGISPSQVYMPDQMGFSF